MKIKHLPIVEKVLRYYENSLVLKRFSRVLTLDVLVRASNFLLLPVYLKLMTQVEFGIYTYIYSLLFGFTLIFNFGFYLAQAKLFHDYEGDKRKALISTIQIMLTIFLFVLFVPSVIFKLDVAFFSLFFSQAETFQAYRWVFLFALFVSIYSYMLYNYLMTSENIRIFQIYNLLKVVIINPVVIYILYVSSEDSVHVRLFYGYIIEFVLLILFSVQYRKVIAWIFDFAISKKVLKIGLPAMLSSIVGLIYSFGDKFLLERFGGFSNVAVYNFAMTVAGILTVIFTSFQTVYLPIFFKEKDSAKNFAKTKMIIPKMILAFTGLGAGIVFLIWALLSVNLIDEKYNQAIYILPFLLFAQILSAISQLFNNYIIYLEKVYFGTLVILVLGIINIALNILLIPKFNIYGASFTALLVAALSMMIYYYFAKKNIYRISESV